MLIILNREENNVEEVLTPCGLANWTSPGTLTSVYFHSTRPGQILIALRLKVPYGESKISVSLEDSSNKGNQAV